MIPLKIATKREIAKGKDDYRYKVKFDWLRDDFEQQINTFDKFTQFSEIVVHATDEESVSSTLNSITVLDATPYLVLLGKNILITSGACIGSVSRVGSVVGNTINLDYKLPIALSSGDTFKVYSIQGVGGFSSNIELANNGSFGFSIVPGSFGDGSITDVEYKFSAFSEVWTLLCISGGANARFVVKGSGVGVQEDGYAGTQYSNRYVKFKIVNGTRVFEEGDILVIYPAMRSKAPVTIISGSDFMLSPMCESGPDYLFWNTIKWKGSLGVAVEVRSTSSVSSGVWTDWVEVSNGENIAGLVYGRYLQFRISFSQIDEYIYDLRVSYSVKSHTSDSTQFDYVDGFNRAKSIRVSRSKADTLKGYGASDANITLSNEDGLLSPYSRYSTYKGYISSGVGISISIIYSGQEFPKFQGYVNSFSYESSGSTVSARCRDKVRKFIKKKVVKGDIAYRVWTGRKLSFLLKALMIDSGVSTTLLDMRELLQDPVVTFASFKGKEVWSIMQEIASGVLADIYCDESGVIKVTDSMAIDRMVAPPEFFQDSVHCVGAVFDSYSGFIFANYRKSSGVSDAYIINSGESELLKDNVLGMCVAKLSDIYVFFTDSTNLYRAQVSDGQRVGYADVDTEVGVTLTNLIKFDRATLVDGRPDLQRSIIMAGWKLGTLRLFRRSDSTVSGYITRTTKSNELVTYDEVYTYLGVPRSVLYTSSVIELEYGISSVQSVSVFEEVVDEVPGSSTPAICKISIYTGTVQPLMDLSTVVIKEANGTSKMLLFRVVGNPAPDPVIAIPFEKVNVDPLFTPEQVALEVQAAAILLGFTSTVVGRFCYITNTLPGRVTGYLTATPGTGSDFSTSGLEAVVETSGTEKLYTVVSQERLIYDGTVNLDLLFNPADGVDGGPSMAYWLPLDSNRGYTPSSWRVVGDSKILIFRPKYANTQYTVVYEPVSLFDEIANTLIPNTSTSILHSVFSERLYSIYDIFYKSGSVYHGHVFYIRDRGPILTMGSTSEAFGVGYTDMEVIVFEDTALYSSINSVVQLPDETSVLVIYTTPGGVIRVRSLSLTEGHSVKDSILGVPTSFVMYGATYDYTKHAVLIYGSETGVQGTYAKSYMYSTESVVTDFTNLAGKPVAEVIVTDPVLATAGDHYWYFQKFGGLLASTGFIYAWTDSMVSTQDKVRCTIRQEVIQAENLGDGVSKKFILPATHRYPNKFDVRYVYVNGADIGSEFVYDSEEIVYLTFIPAVGDIVTFGSGKEIVKYQGVFLEEPYSPTVTNTWGTLQFNQLEAPSRVRVVTGNNCINNTVTITGTNRRQEQVTEVLTFFNPDGVTLSGDLYCETAETFIWIYNIDASSMWADSTSSLQVESAIDSLIPGVAVNIYTSPNTVEDQFGGDGTVAGYTNKVNISIFTVKGLEDVDTQYGITSFSSADSDIRSSSVYIGTGDSGEIYVRTSEDVAIPYFKMEYDSNLTSLSLNDSEDNIKNKIIVKSSALEPVPFREVDIDSGEYVGDEVIPSRLISLGWSNDDYLWSRMQRVWDMRAPHYLYKGNYLDYDITFQNPIYAGDIQSNIRYDLNYIQMLGRLDDDGNFKIGDPDSEFKEHYVDDIRRVVHAGSGPGFGINVNNKIYRIFAPFDTENVIAPAEYPSRYNTEREIWSDAVEYKRLDVVYHNDVMYCSRMGGNLNNEPGLPLDVSWSELSPSYIVPEWNPSITYSDGYIVQRLGVQYTAITANIGMPRVAPYWEFVGTEKQIIGGVRYAAGDIAEYNGMYYMAKSDFVQGISIVAEGGDYFLTHWDFIGINKNYLDAESGTGYIKTSDGVLKNNDAVVPASYVQTYSDTTEYTGGDLVISDGVIYEAKPLNFGVDPLSMYIAGTIHRWRTPTDVTWWVDSIKYEKGDLVYYAKTKSVYRCLIGNKGEPPYNKDFKGLPNIFWKEVVEGVVVSFNPKTKNKNGGIVVKNRKLFEFISINKGVPVTEEHFWTKVTTAYDYSVDRQYRVGDHAFYLGALYVCTLDFGEIGNPFEWVPAVISSPMVSATGSSYLLPYSPTDNYPTGSYVIDATNVYVATATNINMEPSVSPDYWSVYSSGTTSYDWSDTQQYLANMLVYHDYSYYFSNAQPSIGEEPGTSSVWDFVSVEGGAAGDFTFGTGPGSRVNFKGGIILTEGNTIFDIALDDGAFVSIDMSIFVPENSDSVPSAVQYTVYAEDVVRAINTLLPGVASVGTSTLVDSERVYVKIVSTTMLPNSAISVSQHGASTAAQQLFGSSNIRRTALQNVTFGEYEKLGTEIFVGDAKKSFTYYAGDYTFELGTFDGEQVFVIVLGDALREAARGQIVQLNYPMRLGVNRFDIDKRYMGGSGLITSLLRSDGTIRAIKSLTPRGSLYTVKHGISGFHLNVLWDDDIAYADSAYLRVENPTDRVSDSLYDPTENPSGMSIWVSRVEMRGRPLLAVETELAAVYDMESIKKYQESEEVYQNDYIQDAVSAKKIANYILPRKSKPIGQASVGCIGLPMLVLGDIIGVKDIATSLDYDLFEITSCEDSISEGSGYTMNIDLKKVRDAYSRTKIPEGEFIERVGVLQKFTGGLV